MPPSRSIGARRRKCRAGTRLPTSNRSTPVAGTESSRRVGNLRSMEVDKRSAGEQNISYCLRANRDLVFIFQSLVVGLQNC